MAIPLDDAARQLAKGGRKSAQAAREARQLERARELQGNPSGLELLKRIPLPSTEIPAPRKSVERPPNPREDDIRIFAEGDDFRSYGPGDFSTVNVGITDDAYQISWSAMGPRDRGQGLGVATYRRAADDALADGKLFKSDTTVSDEAQRVWEALERRGYVIERNDNVKIDEDGFMESTDGEAVFTIVGRQGEVEDGT